MPWIRVDRDARRFLIRHEYSKWTQILDNHTNRQKLRRMGCDFKSPPCSNSTKERGGDSKVDWESKKEEVVSRSGLGKHRTLGNEEKERVK